DLLMASDDPEHSGYGPDQRIMVSYDAADADDARRVFDALAAGGQVPQEPQQTFFSDAFGMCADRFGTPWLVVAPRPGARRRRSSAAVAPASRRGRGAGQPLPGPHQARVVEAALVDARAPVAQPPAGVRGDPVGADVVGVGAQHDVGQLEGE